MAYSAKNAVGPTGMGGNNPLSGEQVLQGVMNPTANGLNVAVLDSSGNPITAANPFQTAATVTPPTPGASTKATFVRGLKAPASVTVPEALAAAGTYVQSVTIWAGRTGRVANAGIVYIDSIATNDLQQVAISPGGAVVVEAPPGKVIDLGDLYVDAVTLTDGVLFLGML